jgi:uroporphyrinogen-III synthase
MANDLSSLRVMVTRPAQQAGPLIQQLQASGANPWSFPLLEVVPHTSPLLDQLISQLDQYDIAIFISPNAVRYGVDAVKQRRAWPNRLRLATIGKGSAQELEDQLGRPADIVPATGSDSEALLEHSALQEVAGKQVLIFRGRNGRELLAKTLRARGAQVDYAEVYERHRPDVDTAPLNTALQSGSIDVILITSNEALDNLLSMVEATNLDALYQIPLVVIHPRQAERARQVGFIYNPILAHDGSVSAIIEALTSLRASA